MRAQQLAKAGVLYAPANFLNATAQELSSTCNGCGAADSWFCPPHKLYGTEILSACNIHDWMYQNGHTIEDKEEADRVFLNNMIRLINLDARWYSWLQRRIAYQYYLTVDRFGGHAFWSKK